MGGNIDTPNPVPISMPNSRSQVPIRGAEFSAEFVAVFVFERSFRSAEFLVVFVHHRPKNLPIFCRNYVFFV